MDQDIDIAQKTGTRVSQAVGIGVISLAGAAAAAAFLFLGSIKQPYTRSVPTGASTTITSVDVSKSAIPPKELLTSTAVTVPATLDTSVSVTITSPTEGAAVDGGTPVTVQLTDPNHKAAGVQVRLYGKLLPDYLQGTGSAIIRTAPYTFYLNYAMYPSGEYRYVAQAVDAAGLVLAESDTMVTWVRSCYWLAYQDMTLTAPTSDVTPGTSFTLTGTVTNPNRGNCPHVYDLTTNDLFGISSLLPTGWTATLIPAKLTMGINEKQSYSVKINVPAYTSTNDYSVGVTSKLEYTGFVVSQKATVHVVASGGGGDNGGELIIPKKGL